jgi:ATP/maltotriose-dependent transcriptional regulator MalT/DNA-binding SARP family transcriptional activator
LRKKIEQSLGRKRSSGDVFLMTAPAGYGKSTAILQWATSSSVPVVWCHLDRLDNDPVSFVRGVVGALRTRLRHAEWSAERVLGCVRPGTLSARDIHNAIGALSADITRNVSAPMALVLTGVGELAHSSGGHAMLDGLLGRPADHLRLVLESRETPRLGISTLVAQHRIEGLGADDLRLTDDELLLLLDLIGATVTTDDVDVLRRLCNGWITGVLLAAGGLGPGFLRPPAGAELDPVLACDYLAREVLDNLPPALHQFAMEAAVLDRMTVPLCASLFELSDAVAAERLIELDKHTGFVTRTGRPPQERVYRFQPLLRQALLLRLEASPRGEERRGELHERAGMLHDALSESDEAIHQFAQAGAYERVIAIIEAKQGPMVRSGLGATVAAWLALVPDSIRAAHPELQVLLAEMYQQSGKVSAARTLAEQACERLLPDAEKHPVVAARALVTRATAMYVAGEYDGAVRDGEAALRLVPADAVDLRIQVHFRLAAAAYARSGLAAARDYLDAIEVDAARHRDIWALARLHYIRSAIFLDAGTYELAESEASAALRYAEEADDEIDVINSRLNLGAIRGRLNAPVEARAHFEVARGRAEVIGYTLGHAYALMNLAELELREGRPEVAVPMYEDALRWAATSGEARLHAQVTADLAYARAVDGDPLGASILLRDALTRCGESGGAEWCVLANVRAFALFRLGQLDEAEALLRQVTSAALALGAARSCSYAQLHLAAVLVVQGREDAARNALGDACDAAGSEGASTLLLESSHLPELHPLIKAMKHPVAVALAQRLAALRSAVPTLSSSGPIAAEDRGEVPIRVFAFGEARVFAGDERVERWRMPHARELLFFLLDQGEPVSRDTIIEALWPDSDPDVAGNRLRQVRFRLKEALGRDCLAQVDGRWRLTIDRWVDVRACEQLLDTGGRLATEGHLADAAMALTRALSYMTGDYLEDCYSDWAVLRRDQLRRRYLEALELLADIETRLGRESEAAQHYFQILEAEPHREVAHRGLMRHYERRGEPAAAIQQFARCVNLLKRDVHSPPAPETIALYRAIRAKLDAPKASVLR